MADNGVREFGNTEFTADLEEYLSKDPIARLGFDPDVIRYDPKIGKNAFVTKSGKVIYGPELGSSKAVILHEFRHRGLNKLREMIENDVGSFEGKYSQEALLELLKTDRKEQERLTEIFDHLDSTYITPRGESDNLLWSLDTISPEENFDRETDPEKRKLYNEIYKIAEDQLKGYNKGGLVTMDEQMSMFDVKGFAEGGMATDPVSGNEIPPGSSAEEVRDDIDAKLSEGEYVVPADVVQYYGVKFFEKLREKAKADLEEMVSDGRIGGEPIEDDEEPEDDEEELSPEEMAMLQEVMSQDNGNVEMQMAKGGLVPKADKNMQPTFDPKKWQSMGASLINSGASQSGSLYKTFVGPSGEVRMILFVNGKPITPIPKGFKEKTSQPTQAKVEEPAYNNQADEGRDKREDREQSTDSKSWAERNYEALSTDPVKFGMEQLKGGLEDKLGPLGATMIGGPVFGSIAAAGAQVENIASAKAAERIAQSKGLDTTELSSSIKSAEENLSGFGKLATQTFNAASGDNYYKSWEETNSERSRDKGVTNSASRTPSTAGPRDETGSNGGGVYSPDSRPEGPSSKPEGGTGGAGVGGGPSTGPSKSDMQKDIGEQGGYQGGYGFKKGGLVTKKVKPAKNKGLVTKRK